MTILHVHPMTRLRIANCRLHEGFSIEEAARRSGIPPPVWEGIESGDEPLTAELLARIADLFQVSVEFLVLGFDRIEIDPCYLMYLLGVDDIDRA